MGNKAPKKNTSILPTILTLLKWALALLGIGGVTWVLAFLPSAFTKGADMTVQEILRELRPFDVYTVSAAFVVIPVLVGYQLHRFLGDESNHQKRLPRISAGFLTILIGLSLLFFSGIGIGFTFENKVLPSLARSESPATVLTTAPMPPSPFVPIPTNTQTPPPTIALTSTPIPECESREDPAKPCWWQARSGDTYVNIAAAAYPDDSYALVILNLNRSSDGYRRLMEGYFFLPSEDEVAFESPSVPVYPSSYPTCTRLGAKPCLYMTRPRDDYSGIAAEYYEFSGASECIRAANLIYDRQIQNFELLDETDLQGKMLLLPRYDARYCHR
jgi:hypothetical protein